MKRLDSGFSKVLVMLLLAGIVTFGISGCSGANKENNSEATSKPTSQNNRVDINESGSKADNGVDSEPTIEPTIEPAVKTLNDVDSENALKLATGLLLGIAEAGIIPTEQPTVVVVKPGETSCIIGTSDILKKVQLSEVPKINVLDSKNSAWRITFTYEPVITIEVIDDVDNPKKVIKLYPEKDI